MLDNNTNDLNYYVQLLTDDISLIDNLSDDMVDILIKYLEKEISEKEKILSELEKNNR